MSRAAGRSARFPRLLPLVALAGLGGCGGGPRTYPVAGKLVYDDDTPVPGATVVFQTDHEGKTVAARGMVNKDGTFRLTTFKDDDGVIAGEHRVSVGPLPPVGEAGPPAPVVGRSYGDDKTSGLTATVTPETREVKLTIKRPGKK